MVDDEIRPLRADDTDEWLRMRRELFPDDGDAVHEFEMQLQAGDRDGYTTFVCDRGDGRLGGFVEVSERNRADGALTTPVAYLESWYVDPDRRGTGVAGRLVAAAESWARARGLSEMASDTWVDNHVSLAAHKKLGFREMDRIITLLKRIGPEK
jgi:aminoglycoside 6'-N-acetyltransferase I